MGSLRLGGTNRTLFFNALARWYEHGQYSGDKQFAFSQRATKVADGSTLAAALLLDKLLHHAHNVVDAQKSAASRSDIAPI
ncbi:ATP-binding protein [Pseudomonas sp. NFR09]|uniref:ATP-binding protein n=1 Tax=Pseudomonas sp. NFR09 TaxID=1566249 RepID=UPI000B838E1B|nr:ATP-binding protein [Pseudomonas sp. NFR09]